jgi:hypothetical protein
MAAKAPRLAAARAMKAQWWLVTLLVSVAWWTDVTVRPSDPGDCWAACQPQATQALGGGDHALTKTGDDLGCF